jgi:flagellar biosynthesis/type III secretory pathway chaperone
MGLSDVSNILWRERQLLELLLFKLEEEQLVLASGRARWLSHATREVEMVLAEIKRVELDRAIRVEETAAQLGCSSCPTLRELGERAPAPWAKILADHRIALLELAQEIDALAQTNRDLLGRGFRATQEALASLIEPHVDTYTPTGATQSPSGRLGLVNESL